MEADEMKALLLEIYERARASEDARDFTLWVIEHKALAQLLTTGELDTNTPTHQG